MTLRKISGKNQFQNVLRAPVALVAFGPEGHGVKRLEPDALLEHFDALPALAARLLGVPA